MDEAELKAREIAQKFNLYTRWGVTTVLWPKLVKAITQALRDAGSLNDAMHKRSCTFNQNQALIKENAELRDAVKEKEAEIEQYRKVAFEEVTLPNPELEQDQAFLAFKLNKLRSQLKEKDEYISQIEGELKVCQNTLGTMAAEIIQLKAELDTLRCDGKNHRYREGATFEIKNLQCGCGKYLTHPDVVRREVEALRKENERLDDHKRTHRRFKRCY